MFFTECYKTLSIHLASYIVDHLCLAANTTLHQESWTSMHTLQTKTLTYPQCGIPV